jgi:tetratricopeptide (TPR) repeat protein
VTPSVSPSPSAPAAQGRAAVDSAVAIPPASGGSLFLHGPGVAAVSEHPAAALPFWRDQSEERPTLLLVANDPFLERIPETLATAVGELLEKGGAEEIVLKSSPQSPDPLLLPSMTVRAALKAGWFGKVVWLLPNRAEQEEHSADTIRQQHLDIGAASDTEAASFTLVEGQLLGTIENVPWLVTPAHLFTGTPEPVVIHFDLGLVKTFYRNEVKTPLYPTLAELLEPLRRARLTALAVTVSLSQLTGEVPLDTRFIGFDLATFVAEPQRFEAPLAESWRRRSDALYLQNFFQKEKILALYLEMAAAEPENASVDFGLYQIGRQMKNDEQALAYLDAAVKNDPVYAVEYLELAQQTLHQQRFEPALELMAKAAAALPDNPFIALQRARLLLAQGRKGEALALFQGLRRLPWSPVYYPDLPAQLDAEIDQARQKD